MKTIITDIPHAKMLGTLITGILLMTQVSFAQQPGIKRTDLQRHDLSTPGREVVQVRVDFEPGISFPNHKHPGEEIVYGIEGTLEYRLEGRAPIILKAGEVLFIPAGVPHTVKNIGKDNGAELATYIVEKGKQLLVLVK